MAASTDLLGAAIGLLEGNLTLIKVSTGVKAHFSRALKRMLLMDVVKSSSYSFSAYELYTTFISILYRPIEVHGTCVHLIYPWLSCS